MYKVIMFPLTLAKVSHFSDDFTSLMHHFSPPRTGMRSPDECSIDPTQNVMNVASGFPMSFVMLNGR